MGTDIHGTIELRVNGEWLCYSHIPGRIRNYRMFAKLANVRRSDDMPPLGSRIAQHVYKRLDDFLNHCPNDLTRTTRFSIRANEGHSYCVLTREDFIVFRQWMDENSNLVDASIDGYISGDYYVDRVFGYCCGNTIENPGCENLGWEDSRVIIWFDS